VTSCRITDAETKLLSRAIHEDGTIDREEVAFLSTLKRSAVAVAPAFDRFLFGVLKRVVLVDGIVSDAEAAWLERHLFAGRVLVSAEAVRFLRELKAEARKVGPRFARLYAKWVSPPRLSTAARTRPAPVA